MNLNESLELVKQPVDNYYSTCYAYAKNLIISNQLKNFTSEDVIESYLGSRMPEPREPRVWGSVFRELKKEGVIVKGGFGVYKKACGHGKPVNIWSINDKNK